jgi:hypothetical protein
MVKAPKCSLAWLKTVYNYSDACATVRFSHADESFSKDPLSIKCELLKDLYPFVFRCWIGGKMEETLKIGNKMLGVHFVDELELTVTRPYSTVPIYGDVT